MKTRTIEKSKISNFEFGGSTVKLCNSSSIDKSKIQNFEVSGAEIDRINSDWIQNSMIRKLKIRSSKIGKSEKNIFKDSVFEEVEIDGNRILMMDSETLHGDNQVSFLTGRHVGELSPYFDRIDHFFNFQISTLRITGNDITTSRPSPSFLSSSPQSHPSNFILANNTFDCLPNDCSTNSFLLNSPKHSPLLYKISSNRCRPPLENPCVEPRSISLEDHGITCRISSLVADCACLTEKSSIPSKFPLNYNISVVILGDCEHLTIDQKLADFTQIYIFRTTKLIVQRLPKSLKVLKIFHSTVTLEPSSFLNFPQDWEVSNSKVEHLGLSNLNISSLHLKFSRISHISAAKNSKIKNLHIENCHLESTQHLFEISQTLQMHNSIIFSSPRGLGTISSAQLQNNTLLECCNLIELDSRCDLHFFGSRCVEEDDVSTNHLPITSGSNITSFDVYIAIYLFVSRILL